MTEADWIAQKFQPSQKFCCLHLSAQRTGLVRGLAQSPQGIPVSWRECQGAGPGELPRGLCVAQVCRAGLMQPRNRLDTCSLRPKHLLLV